MSKLVAPQVDKMELRRMHDIIQHNLSEHVQCLK